MKTSKLLFFCFLSLIVVGTLTTVSANNFNSIEFSANNHILIIGDVQPTQIQLDGDFLTYGDAFWISPIIWAYPHTDNGYYYSQNNDTTRPTNNSIHWNSYYTTRFNDTSFQELFNTSTTLTYNIVNGIAVLYVDTTLTMNENQSGWMYVEFGTGAVEYRQVNLSLRQNGVTFNQYLDYGEHTYFTSQPNDLLYGQGTNGFANWGMMLESWNTTIENVTPTNTFYSGEVQTTELHLTNMGEAGNQIDFKQGDTVNVKYYVYITHSDYKPETITDLNELLNATTISGEAPLIGVVLIVMIVLIVTKKLR